jgi:hypothetical protein
MWKNKERSVDLGGVFGLLIIKHVTLQKDCCSRLAVRSRIISTLLPQIHVEYSKGTFPHVINHLSTAILRRAWECSLSFYISDSCIRWR